MTKKIGAISVPKTTPAIDLVNDITKVANINETNGGFGQKIEKMIEKYRQLANQTEEQQATSQDVKNIAVNDSMWVSGTSLLEMKETSIPTLFAPIFPAVGVVVLAGESDTGKSMFLRNMAICASTQRDFLGFSYKGNGKDVIYLSSEDGIQATAALLKVNNKLYKDEQWDKLSFGFVTDDIVNRLKARLEDHPTELIIIDSLSDFYDGKDLNSASQVRQFLRPFTELAQTHQLLIVFLHHIGKRQEKMTPTKNALIGSQSIEAAARAVYLLMRDKHDDNARHLIICKHNYLGMSDKQESFKLRFDTQTFTFDNTGERVPINLLATENDNGRLKAKDVYDYGTEKDFAVFFNDTIGNGLICKTKLIDALKARFSCRQEKADAIIQYYVSKGWLKNVSALPNRYDYKFVNAL